MIRGSTAEGNDALVRKYHWLGAQKPVMSIGWAKKKLNRHEIAFKQSPTDGFQTGNRSLSNRMALDLRGPLDRSRTVGASLAAILSVVKHQFDSNYW
jgi:hypothetical protein